MWRAVPITTGRIMSGSLSSWDAGDRGSKSLELHLDPFVAAIEMVDAGDAGLALCHEPGQDERRRGAEIGRHDRRPAQRGHAVYRRRVAFDADIGAQAPELSHVREPVLIDGVGDGAGAARDGEER